MDVQEAYRVLQATSGIGIGDRVNVLREFRKREMGSTCEQWNLNSTKSLMQDCECEVRSLQTGHVNLTKVGESGIYSFPFFVLEVIEPAKTITKVVTFIDQDGKDVTDKISAETKRNI